MPDVRDAAADEAWSMISIQHLRKSYGNTVAVDDVSLEVAEGEVLGILGPNGAGKTTTVECVAGLRVPQSRRRTPSRRRTGGSQGHAADPTTPDEGPAGLWRKVVLSGQQPPATAGRTTTWSPSLRLASRPPMKRTSSSLM